MSDKDVLAKILKDAIKVESDGYHFYKIAAEKTTDPKGREIFESLASDEIEHMEALKKQYHLYKKEGKLDWQEEELEKKSAFDPSSESPIFSDDFKERIKDSHFEMTALSIGVMLEQNSIEFYRKSAEKSEDPQAKKLFSYLARWEGEHLRALIAQQNYLKEEYWTENRFFPSI